MEVIFVNTFAEQSLSVFVRLSAGTDGRWRFVTEEHSIAPATCSAWSSGADEMAKDLKARVFPPSPATADTSK